MAGGDSHFVIALETAWYLKRFKAGEPSWFLWEKSKCWYHKTGIWYTVEINVCRCQLTWCLMQLRTSEDLYYCGNDYFFWKPEWAWCLFNTCIHTCVYISICLSILYMDTHKHTHMHTRTYMWVKCDFREDERVRTSGRLCCMNVNTGKSPLRSLHRLAPQDEYGDEFLSSRSQRQSLLRAGWRH